MVKNWMRPATCCFTGHRIIPAAVLPGLKEELEQAVREMVDRGVSRFLCGGARGFDTLAAQTVLQLKREYPTLELFLVLPCRDQARGWSSEEAIQYEAVRRRADRVVYMENAYTEGCMHKRNRALVDNSRYCIYYMVQRMGGPAYTVDYAVRQGLEMRPVGLSSEKEE